MKTPTQPPERRFFEPVFVARQPILDRESRVYGFELLFRQAVSAMAAQVADADTATARVIIDGFPLVAETMPGPMKCFINFPEGLLLKQIPLALPRELCVVEILENVRPAPEVLAACRDIKHAGYLLAVDDFVGQPELVPFVEMADIVKVDVLGLAHSQVREIAGPLLGRQTALLAEKVEDGETYRACLDSGFTYFQGYHFSRPEVVSGRKPPVGVVSKVRLLRELAVPDPEPDRIAAILSSDAGLSFRLLKYLNSAAFFRMDKVVSLSQAMLVMGQNPLRKWLMAVLLTEMAHTPIGREVSFQSLARARFLELLAQGGGGWRTGRIPCSCWAFFRAWTRFWGSPWPRWRPNCPWMRTSWRRCAGSQGRPGSCWNWRAISREGVLKRPWMSCPGQGSRPPMRRKSMPRPRCGPGTSWGEGACRHGRPDGR